MAGIKQITVDFDSIRCESMCFEIRKLINCIRNKEELSQQSKLVDH
jgi:hypothetical protein